MPPIYLPAEDSYLLSEVLGKEIQKILKKNFDLKFLEIGSGSGILLETAKKLGIKQEHIYGVDINQEAVSHCQSLGFNCIYSDLFENVNGKFDIIVFNPPYLPEDSKESTDSQLATTGGFTGSEIINEFLKQAENYLEKNGKIFLLTSSLTKKINWQNYHKKRIGKEKLFFEELFVWELRI
ncbi:MAG: HemK2/MTQ2 family protein methyltransferase [Nanoarchaeota archaeon]